MGEDTAMVVWDMLDVDMLDMEDTVLNMPGMEVMVLDMAVVLAMLVLATMARGLLMLSLRPRLMLLFSMVDMAVDMPDLDIPDMEVMVLDMEDMVLDMAVVSTMVKHQIHANKSSKVILLLFSALYWVGIVMLRLNKK